jgi:hypothetical protein
VNSQYTTPVVLSEENVVDPRFYLTIYDSNSVFLRNELVEEFFGKFSSDCGVEPVDHERYGRQHYPLQGRKQQRFIDFATLSKDEGVFGTKGKKTYLTDDGVCYYLKSIRLGGEGLSRFDLYNNKLIDYLLREGTIRPNKGYNLSMEQTQDLLKEAKKTLELLKTKWRVESGTKLQKHSVRGFMQKKMGLGHRNHEASNNAMSVLNFFGIIDFVNEDGTEKVIVR